MNIEYILEKYKKYNLEYDAIDKMFIFRKPVNMKDFIRFRIDLLRSNIKYYNDIRVIGR